MAKKVFRVTGSFEQEHHVQPFSKEIVAADPAAAKEHMLSLLGSKHRAPRRLIEITKVEEVPADRVANPAVRHAAGLTA